MRITYQVEDGYAGKSRPQHVTVPDDEIEECDTREDLETLVETYVREHFEQIVSYAIDYGDLANRTFKGEGG